MRETLFQVERQQMTSLQVQIREMLVSAMLSGQMPAGSPIPSTRTMAKRLKVSRNTVMLAYQALAADGYLQSRERSGFYVSEDVRRGAMERATASSGGGVATNHSTVDWNKRLRLTPASQRNITKPANWHEYPYPFIYGQADAALFPIAAWRDCTRQAMNRKWMDAWTSDLYNEDDPMLVEQIYQRILPRRGIMADKEQILVTLGAQNALYMVASLLIKPTDKVAVEDPGYPDMRNIFAMKTKNIVPVPIDGEGICIDEHLKGCNFVFTTPSHQFPTNITMSADRRRELLAWAEENDALIIEDDYEFETNYNGEPTPALKSRDREGRVIYAGSLSKSLMPGLRMGFVVAPKQLIGELRALRRLMFRHPPGNNQRVVSLFLALGHHDALINRLHKAYQARWKTMGSALEEYFPGWAKWPGFGGTSFWVEGPAALDTNALQTAALEDGIIIEPGQVCWADPQAVKNERTNYFRLGFSSIPEERIRPGLERLHELASRQLRGQGS
ncbi:PLP-dependent aminotransferase family protein [Salaquimonas pukyongi]|uniref:MocR-like pyridoxine biosynthesis transcription factor PdxR n=1 Tax=Salaquimonas pukyongi TaxID=2712698 RepID=UPI00096B72A2|nr:PLP-dependent aminotransferase family protein [Salaquimonas pukyongi]